MSRLTQLKANIDYVVGEYYNGMMDYPEEYPEMSPEKCVDYVKDNIYDIKVTGCRCQYKDGICDELKFLGNEIINFMILMRSGDIMQMA